MWRNLLEQRLEQQRQRDLWRQRVTLSPLPDQRLANGSHTLIDFAGNDYLGLARDPRLAEALAQGARRYGAGSGASHLVSGHLEPHHALEERLAALTGRPRALLFSTGYMANLGTLQVLGAGDVQIYQDRLNHASLLDGGHLSGARSRRFHHRDYDDLARLLSRSPNNKPRLVVSDGVFSMDGDTADISVLADRCQRFDACLMVDDAHGIGVLGEGGSGCVGRRFGSRQVPVLVGTLGKALGSAGAFVAGDDLLIDTLTQFARSYIYTTAQPPGVACATLRALDILESEPERRTILKNHISYWCEQAKRLGLPMIPSETPIQPLLLGDSQRVLMWSHLLRQRGFLVGAIREPTVPRGQARLRITLSAAHTRQSIDALLETLAELATNEPQSDLQEPHP
ncbi:8-amino-7-oxononanoate synthase [Modicisalibacter xianhensis]|uniref:8-amino-7-oxononanoate synthase n=1 Tax=Modicisalibacter xianhensis TaxID=442341 RepID=A0A4R8FBF8_9GAMM|nr:8-amino-7-oxononanoate synthase [Halomonas xianhensis]TDX22976.1 8-amino-7-oxononanoate synthase [Halomonas xianhensis]